MRNAGLDEAQAGIKISRSISNLRYSYDTTLNAESEELKSLLLKAVWRQGSQGFMSVAEGACHCS